MIITWLNALGPWAWLVAAALLLGAEILLPGMFLVWIGIAAAIVGFLSLALWNAGFWVWEFQSLTFAALAVASVLLGRRYVRNDTKTDEPNLNNRSQSLVGRTATLREPITEGRGRVHIDDTVWVVEGPDANIGDRIRITSAHGRTLMVEKV